MSSPNVRTPLALRSRAWPPSSQFRATLPLASFDIYTGSVSYALPSSKMTFLPGKPLPPSSKTPEGSLPDLLSTSLTLVRNNVEAYKALRKYTRKRHSPQNVFDKCLPISSKDVIVLPPIMPLVRSLVEGGRVQAKHVERGEERATVLLDMHDEYEPLGEREGRLRVLGAPFLPPYQRVLFPIFLTQGKNSTRPPALKPHHLLGLYIHGVVAKRVPTSITKGCILNLLVEGRAGDELRTWLKLGMGCTDFLGPACPSLKKKEEPGEKKGGEAR